MECPFVYKLCIKIWKTGADQVIIISEKTITSRTNVARGDDV